jgi:hypothetical protein
MPILLASRDLLRSELDAIYLQIYTPFRNFPLAQIDKIIGKFTKKQLNLKPEDQLREEAKELKMEGRILDYMVTGYVDIHQLLTSIPKQIKEIKRLYSSSPNILEESKVCDY